MSLSTPFIERPIATSLLMIAILFGGFLGYQLLPVSSLPEVDYPTIQVVTFYPGASPNVMASYVTAPLEKQFGQMPGLNQMTSTSSSTASIIILQFTFNMGLDVAEQEVQAAINAATSYLPPNLPNPPIYSKVNPADAPIMTLAFMSKSLPLTQIDDYAETRISQKIAELPGVGLVTISGGQRPAVRVQANATALSARQLGLEDVRSAIATANVNAAKGSFDGPQLAYIINANDQLLSSDEYKPLIIAYRNNAPVRLSDVANVIDGAENTKLAAWMNTTPAVIMNIQRQPGANVIAVVDHLKKLLPQLALVLPTSIDIKILTDRTNTIRASVEDVQFELMIAVMLVVMVIFIFLRNLPATIIPSIAVPLSLIGTFGFMYLLGFSLNNLTLMALTISTGFVVDDAIVMIENISRYIELGDPPMVAAKKGAKQIVFTILSLTVSLIAVLIPLLFMSDLVGKLFREFALTLSVTILLSALVSLTLTPMLCAHFLRPHRNKLDNRFEAKSAAIFQRTAEFYASSLRFALDNQIRVLQIAFVTLALTGLCLYLIPKGFFPVEDTGVIQGISEASTTTSFENMARLQQELTKIILTDKAVDNLASFIGIDGINITQNSGRIQITLKPLAQRDASVSEVINRLQTKLAKVPGITLYMQPTQDLTISDRTTRTQYQYSIGSPDIEDVNKWTHLLIKELKNTNALRDLASDQQEAGLITNLTIDRDTASRLGINTQLIDDTLYDAFGQRQVSNLYTERNQYHVVLEALPAQQQGPSALNNIYIKTTTGGAVPLSAITSITQTTNPLVLNRQGQFPVATISFNLNPNGALGDAVDAISQAKKTIGLPLKMQTSFEGAAKVFQDSLNNEGWLVLAAIIVVYIVLGVLYESYIHPITILSTLPSAGLGALCALMLTHQSLSVIALIGIILLIGIVMKNAIMMIDFALEQERVYNKPPLDAIYEAALLRFRPILMTTLAALFGAIPLALGNGMGAELRNPLGIAIIGGLAVSQLLTLYTTPVIYLMFDKLSRTVMAWGADKLQQESS